MAVVWLLMALFCGLKSNQYNFHLFAEKFLISLFTKDGRYAPQFIE